MSIQGLNWAIKQKTVTPTTKLVLFILSNYADENGSSYPSEKKLAEIVGVSDRQIRRCLKNLVDNNLITYEQRKGTSNRYFLSMDTGVLSMDTEVHPVRKSVSTNTKEDTKANTYSDNFEMFWKLYPRKVGKFNAAKAFTKATSISFFDDIMKALLIFMKENERTEPQFIPHAATWLNQKRFLDYKDKKVKKNNLNSIAG